MLNAESNHDFSELAHLPQSTEISIATIRQGIVDKFGFIVSRGALSTTVNSDKLYEVGSITKAFTTLSAIVVLNRRGIDLDSTIAQYLSDDPPSVLNTITFRDLMTHRAGFPKMPRNFFWSVVKDPGNPFLNYKMKQFVHYLRACKSRVNPDFVYSNFGMALLGLVLSEIDGRPLASILDQDIFIPLRMGQSSLGMQDNRLAGVLAGHGARDTDKNTWEFSRESSGAGAIISSLDDFTRFLEAILWTDHPDLLVNESLNKMAVVQHEIDETEAMALGWRVFRGQPNLFYHGGNTYNFKSLLAFDLENRTAIVILTSATSLSRKEVKALKKIGLNFLRKNTRTHESTL